MVLRNINKSSYSHNYKSRPLNNNIILKVTLINTKLTSTLVSINPF